MQKNNIDDNTKSKNVDDKSSKQTFLEDGIVKTRISQKEFFDTAKIWAPEKYEDIRKSVNLAKKKI